MLVEFIEVGRNKKSWTANHEGIPGREWLLAKIKESGALLSDDVDIDGWEICAGGRTVGRVRWANEEHPGEA